MIDPYVHIQEVDATTQWFVDRLDEQEAAHDGDALIISGLARHRVAAKATYVGTRGVLDALLDPDDSRG